MWRLARAFVTVLFTFATAFSPAPAHAGQPCPYWIFVSREGSFGEETAWVCRIGGILAWLRVIPGANVSAQGPPGPLNDRFTITVGAAKPNTEAPPPPGLQRERSTILKVSVYPVAESGPVAFVQSRSIFHGRGRYPRWVVQAGWRSLDASKRVPTVLTKLGMLQPTAAPTTPTFTPTTTPTFPPTSATSATGSSRPGPDLVTLLFLVAFLVSVGVAIRRSVVRTRPQIGDGLDSHSEPSHHG
jgi:hypothetical protein